MDVRVDSLWRCLACRGVFIVTSVNSGVVEYKWFKPAYDNNHKLSLHEFLGGYEPLSTYEALSLTSGLSDG